MNRRSVARRLERVEGRLGTGRRFLKVEYYRQERDGTLVRLPKSDEGDGGKAGRIMRVVFVHSNRDGSSRE